MSVNGKRILLIDDDQDIHEAIKMILAPLGCSVTCCSTGPAGLEALRASTPDLLLLDIMLASPSEGFHLAYEMKQDDVLRDVPIIMISAIGETMGMDFKDALGTEYVQADVFLEKPLEAATLREAVQKVLAAGE